MAEDFGWGGEEWGADEWGGTEIAGSFDLVSALAVRENVVRMLFSEPVKITNLLDPGDGSSRKFYSITPVADTYGADGTSARPVSSAKVALVPGVPNAVDVTLDRPLTPYPARYTAAAAGLFSQTGAELIPSSVPFLGLYRALPKPTSDLVATTIDIANPQNRAALIASVPSSTDDSLLGTIPVDDTGDAAVDMGIISYTKRVLRRLNTKRGAYAHMRNYGVSALQHVKQLARPGLVQSIATEAEEQIRQEPETVSVTVQIVQEGSMVMYKIRAFANFTNRPLTIEAPVQVDSG